VTDYPGSGETIADDADRILQARRMFERSVQLIAVANDELNKPLALLRDTLGEDTRGFRQVNADVQQIKQQLQDIATKIGTVRFRLDQTATAIKRAGS
jgi:uncharacterized phage infection (PIP) family protein YhgE